MLTKAAQWGNSIGVRIPKDFAKRAGIDAESSVEIDEADDRIIIKAVGRKEYSLKELVRRITSQNRHAEVDFGHPVGKEHV